MPQKVLRIRPNVHLCLIGFLRAVRAEDRSLEMTKPLNFVLKFRLGEVNILDVVKTSHMADESEWTVSESEIETPAIVSKEQFELANVNINVKKHNNQHTHESPFLLTSLIYCENCGHRYEYQV